MILYADRYLNQQILGINQMESFCSAVFELCLSSFVLLYYKYSWMNFAASMKNIFNPRS